MFEGDYLKIIELIKTYLIQVTTYQPNTVDVFVNYWIPIIQVIIILLGAVAGLYKYYSSKNKEISEKILNDVYAPLYQYFVKQELFCFITEFERDIKEMPILELIEEKRNRTISMNINQNVKIEDTAIIQTKLGLDRREFLKVLESTNIGLASKELYTLLNMYKVLIHFEGMSDKTPDAFLNATIMAIDVENALRVEIIKGYEHYHKKLKLDKITSSGFYSIKDNSINFDYTVDEVVKAERLQDIKEKPGEYQ